MYAYSKISSLESGGCACQIRRIRENGTHRRRIRKTKVAILENVSSVSLITFGRCFRKYDVGVEREKSSIFILLASLPHNLLMLDNIHSLQVALFMYSVHFLVHTNSIPSTGTFQIMFNKNFETNQYSTRQANSYKIQFTRTNILRFSIASSGPRLWNSLPNDLKSKQSLPSFKKHLKHYLLIQTIDSI